MNKYFISAIFWRE